MLKKIVQSIFSVKNDYCMLGNNIIIKKHKIVRIFGMKKKFNLCKLTDNGNQVIFIKNGKEYTPKGKLKYFDSIKLFGKNNIVKINVDFENLNGNKTIIIYGNDNIVDINAKVLDCIEISIKGDENKIVIGKDCIINNLGLYFNFVRNNKILFGDKTSVSGAKFHAWANNASIKIGEDCMFSWDIQFMTSDAHTIIDNETKECINSGDKFIEIGNHVWIGHGVKILKNIKIADNSIVGACSVVTRQFEEPNVVIAGNPAKIIKRNIDWSREQA